MKFVEILQNLVEFIEVLQNLVEFIEILLPHFLTINLNKKRVLETPFFCGNQGLNTEN